MAFFKKLMGGGSQDDDLGEIKVTSVEPPSAKAAAEAEAAARQAQVEAQQRREAAQDAPAPSATPPAAPPMEPEVEIYLNENYSLDDLLIKLMEVDGSDLHLAVGSPPCMRVHGELVYSKAKPITEEKIRTFFGVIPEEKRQKMVASGNADFGYEVKGVARFRGNCFRQHHGSSMVFRVIPSKIPTVEELNLPPILNEIAEMQRGLVVVTGPTGSGKSTTMAAMINHLNRNRKAHIITIEDPIEFFHPSLQCLIDHREVGEHAVSFSDALRASLREDPDIILVGEMRDLETIYLAIKAAETGALVFGTLHTNSAAKTIDRIIDVFPAKQQNQIRSMLADSMKAIVAQLLLKRCDKPGRVAVQEILLSREGFPNLVREGKTSQLKNYLMTGAQYGMQSMDTGLLTLLKEGKIDIYAVRELTNDPDFFDRMGYKLW